MATRILGPTRSRRRRRFLAAPVLLALLVGFLIIGGAQGAPDDNGLFELDANVIDNPAGPPDDWSNIFAGDDSAFEDTGIVADPAPQTIFTGGGSKDDLDIPGWKHKNGSVPDKDDITNSYAAAYTAGGDTFIYFGMDRFAVQGSSNVGFWFLQDDVAPVAGGTFSGQHELGDILVLSEFSDGGGGIAIKVFEWVGTGGDEGGGTLQTLFGGATGAPADCDDTGTAATVCANVNTAPILDADIPWNYVGKSGTRNMPTASFFEGGINLSALLPEEPCITNMVAETRSSFEVNAVLKDFVHSNFELCGANISIAADDVNDVGDPHTFTVNVNTTIAGQPTPAPDGTIVDVTLTHSNAAGNPVTPTTDTCASPGTVGGTCEVTFSSNVAGTITGHAEADVEVGGTTIHVETGGTGNNPDAFKAFVDGRVSITPSDVNGIGEPHTFVVDADQNTGSGFVAATNGNVDVTLTDANGAINQINAAASTCDDAQPDGDNLDANGQCTITFTSNTAGTVTGHATVSMNLTTSEGPITIVRETDGAGGNTGDAVKEFVDGSLAWLKNDDQGNRLGGASFEVCRTHDLDTSTTPDTFIDITPDVCVTVLDNAAPDANPADGEFLLEDLKLGRYTVDEVAPFPPGYEPDPDVVTAELTLEPGPKDVVISEAFVNRQLFKVIVVTCNDSVDPEVLVDSTVRLPASGGTQKQTITGVPPHLAAKGVTQADLCAIGGASYGDLPANPALGAEIELPDVPPLFP
jgi:Prealbumin-like fold domain